MVAQERIGPRRDVPRRSGPIIGVPLLVHLSSERMLEPVHQDSCLAEKQESHPCAPARGPFGLLALTCETLGTTGIAGRRRGPAQPARPARHDCHARAGRRDAAARRPELAPPPPTHDSPLRPRPSRRQPSRAPARTDRRSGRGNAADPKRKPGQAAQGLARRRRAVCSRSQRRTTGSGRICRPLSLLAQRSSARSLARSAARSCPLHLLGPTRRECSPVEPSIQRRHGV
jgi:hypothetical protein